jgi:hypothetical protein
MQSKKKAPEREFYEERLQRLAQSEAGQPSALEQAEIAIEELKKVAEEKGLAPADVTVLLAVSIPGEEAVKCVYCGRPSCQFRPTTYRQKNPEIDLLGDALAVFQEKMTEAGFRYGLIVYDDLDVLMLREPALGDDLKERAQTLGRYFSFRDRLEYPNPVDQAWMQATLAKWRPAFATRQQAGLALDKPMFEAGFRALEANRTAVQAMVVAKNQPPSDGTFGIAARAEQAGIRLSGIAIGANAAEVAAGMAFPSVAAPDLHGLRDRMRDWTKALADAIREEKAAA